MNAPSSAARAKGRKHRMTFRLQKDNYAYLRRLAFERDTDLNTEINRLLLEQRQHDGNLTATHSIPTPTV